MKKTAMYDCVPDADAIVIGGGAAGMFAACRLSQLGVKAIVIEPNRSLGRKLRITGKGRCNLTNNCSCENVIKNVVTNPRFLYSAVNGFSPEDTMEWFERAGVPLKTERGNRVFPVSDRADDVAHAMERMLDRYGVKIIRDRALEIMADGGAVCGVKCEKCSYYARNVILATGGLSYPKTGSTGDGYKMAGSLGHDIIAPKASLVPVVADERFVSELGGLLLKNVTLTLFEKDRKSHVFSELGEVGFSPYGILGPLALSASSFMREEKLRERAYVLNIDLKPGLSHEQLYNRICRDFSETPSAAFEKSLTRLLPLQIIPTVVKLSDISPNKPCNQVTKAEREALAGLLKRFVLTPVCLRPIDEAIITSGGVSVKQINPSTMESKLVKGLYFAGEIIDADALTGGYNLQIAFSTANAAAAAIAADSSKGEKGV